MPHKSIDRVLTLNTKILRFWENNKSNFKFVTFDELLIMIIDFALKFSYIEDLENVEISLSEAENFVCQFFLQLSTTGMTKSNSLLTNPKFFCFTRLKLKLYNFCESIKILLKQ